MSVCCHAQNDWNCSNCWHITVTMLVNRTVKSALKLALQFEIFRPKMAGFQMVLHRQVCSISYALVKDVIAATF